MKNWTYLWILGLLLCGGEGTRAQDRPWSNNEFAASSARLMEATREFKVNSEGLLALQESEIKEATQRVQQLRLLVADGLIARNELTEAEDSIAALLTVLEVTRKQIGDSDQMIAEIQSAELLRTQTVARSKSVQARSFVKPTGLRYAGAANWSLANLGGIQSFFSSTFGRALPTSTVGQSVTHNRLGWDHRNSVDVGLHPDSEEGKTLISFLQSQAIPFLAFRGAIPGVSTGAHIHIGRPSKRLLLGTNALIWDVQFSSLVRLAH